MSDTMIAQLTKNGSERLHISLGQFNGYELVQQRVYFDAGGGEFRPGKQGLALRVEMLPALIDALVEAKAEAERQGLLPARRAA